MANHRTGIQDARRLRRGLAESLRDALRAHDEIATAALRSVLSAIDNAGSVDEAGGPEPSSHHVTKARLGVGVADVGRRELAADDVATILRSEIDERLSAAAEYERLGRPGEATRLRAEAATLEPYLAD